MGSEPVGRDGTVSYGTGAQRLMGILGGMPGARPCHGAVVSVHMALGKEEVLLKFRKGEAGGKSVPTPRRGPLEGAPENRALASSLG